MLRRAFLVAAATLAGTAIAGPAMAADKHTTTVFVAGDSTAATWPADVKPKAGWGQALPAFLDQRRVRVRNLALSGASSKSFVEAGLLDQILGEIRPGDYLIISFGHNDEKTDDRHTDPYTTFQQYLSMYIDGARAHRAQPVLVTPVERRRFDADGHAKASHGEYPAAMLDLAGKAHVPSVDLTSLSMALWDSAGVEGTKNSFLFQAPGANPNFPDGVEDNTHFQAHGAIEVARLVAKSLARQRILPIWDFTRLDAPVPDEALVWPESI
jgi:lysophospholipase L1-like esterase